MIESYKEHEYLIYDMYFDNKKQILLSGADDNSIVIWDVLANGLLKKNREIKNFSNSVRSILKVNDKYIVTTGDGKIILFNEVMDKREEFKIHDGIIVCAKYINNNLFTGDALGNLIVSTITDNNISIKKRYTLNDTIRIIESIDNTLIVISKTGEILSIKLESLK